MLLLTIKRSLSLVAINFPLSDVTFSLSLALSLSLFHVGSTFQCWILSNSLSTFFQINSSHPPCSLCVPLSDNITTTPFSLSLFLSSLIPDTFSLVFGVLSVSLSRTHCVYHPLPHTFHSESLSFSLKQTHTPSPFLTLTSSAHILALFLLGFSNHTQTHTSIYPNKQPK